MTRPFVDRSQFRPIRDVGVSPGPRLWLGLCLLLFLPAGASRAQADFPLQAGEAVATCFSGYNDPRDPGSGIDLHAFVVGVVDVRTPEAQKPPAVPGQHWPAPMYHNENAPKSNRTNSDEDIWTAGNLGQVFGVALDDASPPNIFVTASSTYFPVFDSDGSFAAGSFGELGSGGVYRLDGATGAICEHAQLNLDQKGDPILDDRGQILTGPALGNIAYDRVNRQLFVSNFEDGKIYRVPASSPCGVHVKLLSSFDHGEEGRPAEGLGPMKDDGEHYKRSAVAVERSRTCDPIPNNGFTPLGRRVWGLQVFEGRLYYSVWNEDEGKDRHSPDIGNEIWSIGLLAGGEFDKQDVRREFEVEALTATDFSNPVSDIAFSADGRMLLAERVRCRDHGVEVTNAHSARVLEYDKKPDGLYGRLIREIPIGAVDFRGGVVGHQNSAGGVDYGYDVAAAAVCDQTVWATGDALRLSVAVNPPREAVYGLQGIPDGNFSSPLETHGSSFFVDLDRQITVLDKTSIGDVEVARNDCLNPPCLDQITFESLCVVEDGATTGDFTWRFRIKNESGGPIHHLFLNDLPPGVTADRDHLVFSPAIPDRMFSPPETITLTGVSPGTILEFGISIHDAQLVECCAETVTVEFPDCECAQIVSEQRPGCFIPPFFNPPPYRYRVDLQNLSGRTAQYLVAVAADPDDPNKPILPEDLRIRGPRTLAKPAAPGDTTGSVNFLIDGPDARPGQEVCLFLSLNDAGFRECCTIQRCFTLPDCSFGVDDFVGPPRPVGGTILDFEGGELVLSGFGDGVGGIDVEIPGADVFVTTWAPIDPVDGQGAEIRVTTFGTEEQELATVQARELGGEIEIRAAFQQQRDEIVVEVLDRDGSVVATQTGSSDRVAVTLDDWPAGYVMIENLDGIVLVDNVDGIIIVGHEDTYSVRLPDGTRVEDAIIRIRDANEVSSGSMARAALRVEGLDELRLRTLLAFVDCDGDGVPDDQAIAQGLVEDLDGDGVPDGCQEGGPAILVHKPAVLEP